MLATDAGYTFREIDELYLDDVDVLQRYWERSPPLRSIVAAIAGGFGWTPPTPALRSDEQPAEVPPEWEE